MAYATLKTQRRYDGIQDNIPRLYTHVPGLRSRIGRVFTKRRTALEKISNTPTHAISDAARTSWVSFCVFAVFFSRTSIFSNKSKKSSDNFVSVWFAAMARNHSARRKKMA